MREYIETEFSGVEEVDYKLEPYIRIFVCGNMKDTRCGDFFSKEDFKELKKELKKNIYYRENYFRLSQTSTCLGICPRADKNEVIIYITKTDKFEKKLIDNNKFRSKYYVVDISYKTNMKNIIETNCKIIEGHINN